MPPRTGGPAPRSGPAGAAARKGSLVPDAAGRQIVVHGLPWSLDTDGFSELMGRAGTVEKAEVMKDPRDGRSKGWGIAVMADTASAEKAIEVFMGYEYDGRMLTAKIDRYAE